MSRSIGISCDAPGCKEVKRETNNWWIIRQTPSGFRVDPMSEAEDREGDLHICGQKCMHNMLDDYMQAVINGHRDQQRAAKMPSGVEIIDIGVEQPYE